MTIAWTYMSKAFNWKKWCVNFDRSRNNVKLFLIYINDTTKASSFHTTLFADDINLHMSNFCFNVLHTTVNLELCKIDHWLRANKLSLNYNKTNFMLLTSRKHNSASFKVTISNHTISPEDNLKYLGVLIDNKLSWKPHVQKVKTQLSRACGILSKLYITNCTETCL